MQVRLYRIHALILQRVSPNLVVQANAPALLSQVEKKAASFLGYMPQGSLELLSTITADGAENVSGQTLRMDADQDGRSIQFAHANCEVLLLFRVSVDGNRKLTKGGR
jgi:hypothetical protein